MVGNFIHDFLLSYFNLFVKYFFLEFQDYQQYSSGNFVGVKAKEDEASVARRKLEEEFRNKDRYCPECEAQVGTDFIKMMSKITNDQSKSLPNCRCGP